MSEITSKGLDGIVVDQTELSSVDGQNGVLVYRGYNIDELANCTYEEVCHLFLYGDLPNKSQISKLEDEIKSYRTIPNAIVRWIVEAPSLNHPMALLRTAVSMLSGYLQEADPKDEKALRRQSVELVSKIGSIAATIGRVRQGKAPLEPDFSLSHAGNFLYMLNGEKADPILVKALDMALVLHADHGFNVSTFTARVVVSSLSDMISALTAAIGSLKGPLHGGANTAVMQMLFEIGHLENVDPWLKDALEHKRKVMGFGHRVYKTLDPRAKHLKRMSKEWSERANETKWFSMSEKLEKLIKDSKGLNANVDFYSATTYYAMGIQPELYTVIFAMARSIGWAAHVMEQLKENRLMRPKAEYMGVKDKKYKPVEMR